MRLGFLNFPLYSFFHIHYLVLVLLLDVESLFRLFLRFRLVNRENIQSFGLVILVLFGILPAFELVKELVFCTNFFVYVCFMVTSSGLDCLLLAS